MRIDELRSTLTDRAEEIGSGDTVGRVGAVHSRVGAARRRRRTTAVAAAVATLAVAGAGIVPVLTRDAPAPADRQETPDRLAGLSVPATLTAAGFTYDYVRGLESGAGDESMTYELPESDRPQLVLWGSSDTAQDAVLRLRDKIGTTEQAVPGRLERFTLFDGDVRHPLMLSQPEVPDDARLALAVYEMADEPPAGVSNGTITYREQVLDRPLLGAAIEEPGVAELSFDVTVPETDAAFHSGCYGGAGEDYLMGISVDGKEVGAIGCSDEPSYDAASDSVTLHAAFRGKAPGSTVRVTAALESLDDEQPVQDPDTVMALGVYAAPQREVRVAGWDLPVSQEYAGHEFVNEQTFEGDQGGRVLSVQVRAEDYPRLVTTAVTARGRGEITSWLEADGERSDDMSMSLADASSVSSGLVIQPGESPDLSFHIKGDLDSVRLGLMISRQVD